jgi:hypothetical protein
MYKQGRFLLIEPLGCRKRLFIPNKKGARRLGAHPDDSISIKGSDQV